MSIYKNKKIGVLKGGISREREVSLRSGAAIANALRSKNYDVVEIDWNPKEIQKILEEKIDVFFLALHGRGGEDGTIQGFLETLQIPYTGSGVLTSALAMDKILSKRVLFERGFSTPCFQVFKAGDSIEAFVNNFSLSFPVIVKPSREGSTIGINKVEQAHELHQAIQSALEFDQEILIEEFIQGREITVTVLNGEKLPIVEVKPKSGFYDYQSKYTAGATEYQVPAELPDSLTQRIQETAVEIYKELKCEGVARSDFMIDSENRFFFLEINTLPGMTATSLAPKAAQAVGISFEDLVEKILDSARLKAS